VKVDIFKEKQKNTEGIASPTERIISIVTALMEEVSGKVERDFCLDLGRLLEQIEEKGIIFDAPAEMRFSFGRKECWGYLEEYLDPHFQQIIELYEMVLPESEPIRLPSMQLKSEFSFEYWHSQVVNVVEQLKASELIHSDYKLDIIRLTPAVYKLDVIRLITSCMNTNYGEGEIHYCRHCYRRVPTKNNCRYHMAGTNDFYKDVKKVEPYFDKEIWDEIKNMRGGRGVYGEFPFNHSFFKERAAIARLIHQANWHLSSEWIGKILNMELNNLRDYLSTKIAKQKEKSLFPLHLNFDSYHAFVRWLYSKKILDNLYEESTSAFWLLNTMLAAEVRLKAEKKLEEDLKENSQTITERDEEILKLYNNGNGLSFGQIAKRQGISSKTAWKVYNKHKS